MIRTAFTDEEAADLLGAFDLSTYSIKREVVLLFAARATAFAKLLEQHDHYDLGDGWTIRRALTGRWNVYWKGKHVDAWISESKGDAELTTGKLREYEDAESAVQAASKLALNVVLFVP